MDASWNEGKIDEKMTNSVSETNIQRIDTKNQPRKVITCPANPKEEELTIIPCPLFSGIQAYKESYLSKFIQQNLEDQASILNAKKAQQQPIAAPLIKEKPKKRNRKKEIEYDDPYVYYDEGYVPPSKKIRRSPPAEEQSTTTSNIDQPSSSISKPKPLTKTEIIVSTAERMRTSSVTSGDKMLDQMNEGFIILLSFLSNFVSIDQ